MLISLPKVAFALIQLLILLCINLTSVAAEKYKFETKKFGNYQYQIISAPKLKSIGIKLLGKSPQIKAINESLKHEFEDQLINESGCVEGGGFSINKMTVIDWNKSFIVINKDTAEYCGGAHENRGYHAEVYNLKTGKLENTSLWLKDYKKVYEALDVSEIHKDSELDKKLRELYLKQNSLDEETKMQAESCVEEISFYTSIWATSKGLIFKPSGSYSMFPCFSEVVVPFNDAMPFLSIKGKEAIMAFRK